MSRLALMKLVLATVCVVTLGVAAAALFDVLPARAAILLSALGTLVAVSASYITTFRGPEIKLQLAPAAPFDHRLTSGYSNGLPSTWNIAVNLLASNDGPRPGALTGFAVDGLEHLPREPKAFTMSFTSLEWKKAPDRQQGYSFPLPLPLILAAQAREKVLFRAVLTFTGDPVALADDLRELRGARVRFDYTAGTENAPKRRTGEVELTYDKVRAGVRAYWAGAPSGIFRDYLQRLDRG